jgi:hypothetical protein
MGLFDCTYCAAVVEAEALPPGWQVSFFKDCRAALHYCPNCQGAELAAVARHKALWDDPAANQTYPTFEAWLDALLPLAREYGYVNEGDGWEALEDFARELEWREEWKDGNTPAQVMREELSNAC